VCDDLLRVHPDAELVELRGHVLGRRRGLDVLVDGQNLSVLTNVERPAIPHAHRAEDAVSISGPLREIAEEREVRVLLLSERRVLVERGSCTTSAVGAQGLEFVDERQHVAQLLPGLDDLPRLQMFRSTGEKQETSPTPGCEDAYHSLNSNIQIEEIVVVP
jgi:hypothetical protein